MTERGAVIDASALLAFLFDEPGADLVAGVLDRSAISTVNWVEVCQRSRERGADVVPARERLVGVGMEIVPLSVVDAELAAELRTRTRDLGLSLADRCCLALGHRSGLRVLTADAAWAAADVGVDVVVVR